jgi:hypothetical protein
MKKSQLKQIIKEELEAVLSESISQDEFREEAYKLGKAWGDLKILDFDIALKALRDLYSKLDLGWQDDKAKKNFADRIIRDAFVIYGNPEEQDRLSQLTVDEPWTRYGETVAQMTKDMYK